MSETARKVASLKAWAESTFATGGKATVASVEGATCTLDFGDGRPPRPGYVVPRDMTLDEDDVVVWLGRGGARWIVTVLA